MTCLTWAARPRCYRPRDEHSELRGTVSDAVTDPALRRWPDLPGHMPVDPLQHGPDDRALMPSAGHDLAADRLSRAPKPLVHLRRLARCSEPLATPMGDAAHPQPRHCNASPAAAQASRKPTVSLTAGPRYSSEYLTIEPPGRILKYMLNRTLERSDASLDHVFHALADPGRRMMVERLSRGPASVSELGKPLAMSLAAVVQHVQVLEASGLVRTQKIGRTRTCSIDAAALQSAETWISERRSLWERRLDRLGDYLLDPPGENP